MTDTPATVLIVDDEIKNCELLEALLRPEGYETVSVVSGEAALASIAASAPDLILLDVLMPGMDGYQVAAKLKANPRTCGIPIILVTAKNDRSARLMGLHAGAEEFLSKPVARVELWLRVRNLLRLKAYSDSLQANTNVLERRMQTATVDLKLFHLAMNASTDAIMLIDRDTMTFIHVNDAAGLLHNQSCEALLAAEPMAVFKTSRADLEATYDAIIASGTSPKPFETPHRHADGSEGWVELLCYAQFYGGRRIIVTLWRDVTERKLAENEVLMLNETLERRVAERTAQLAFANEELKTFSYSVSHDLRAPVRHVLGYTAMLLEDAGPSLSGQSMRHLAGISRSAERMSNLIEDLLAFSFVGFTDLKKANVQVGALVREILQELKPQTDGRDCIVQISPLPDVWSDKSLLRIVLVNLLSNAIKFTGARTEARIEIGCASKDEDETVIFVRDNGAGFDQQYAERLFGVFQRLHSQAEFEGTGIGLANVQRIVQRHGGRAWAEGKLDKGAVFYFSIPNRTADSATGEEAASRDFLSAAVLPLNQKSPGNVPAAPAFGARGK